jgi:hypothetical protein
MTKLPECSYFRPGIEVESPDCVMGIGLGSGLKRIARPRWQERKVSGYRGDAKDLGTQPGIKSML